MRMGCDAALVPCGGYGEQQVRRALEQALGLTGGLSFVRPGMTVALKVNLVSAMQPERAATVHPELVCALVRMLRARGANVVIGDSPGGLYTPAHLRRVYDLCGMRQAEALGAQLNEDVTRTEADHPGAVQARHFPFTAWLGRADAVIGVSKLKSHGMMGMTNAVKNFFGVIPGTIKPEYHYRYPRAEDFADVLVDLCEYCRPSLCVCDAVVGMEGNGPTQGTPRHIGCIAAARSAHALDLACAALIGLRAQDVPTLAAAVRRGLCPAEASALQLAGEARTLRVPGFRTAPAQRRMHFHLAGSGPAGRALDGIVGGVLTPRPVLRRSACVGCAACANICPAKAITMKNGRPVICRSRCIRCFCCQEFCPAGAMRVGRKLLPRLLGK